MSGVATAVVGGALISGYMSKEGAENAADTQAAAADRAAQLQNEQFLATQKLLSPYVTAGTNALGGYQPYITGGQQAYGQLTNLMGLGGAGAQSQAISALEQSPEYLAQLSAGENALRQNAAATGGLRGGNTQNALMQYRPELLASTINNQLSRLGGLATTGMNATQNLTQLGQSSAAGVGTAGMNTATNIGNLMQNAAAAQGAAQIAGANAYGNIGSSIAQAAGIYGQMASTSPYSANFGTAFTYGTNPYSQQTSMLATQAF